MSAHKQVVVTQKHIDIATRGDSSHCMIAIAIKEQFPGVTAIAVDLATIRYSLPDKRERHIFLTPFSAQQALLDFDNGVTVVPLKFRLPKAAHIIPMGNRGKARVRKPATLSNTAHDRREGATPTRIGGTAPPTGALRTPATRKRTGKIRGFGARAMTR